MSKPKLSYWWAMQASFWYWRDYGLSLLPDPRYWCTAWWHGFYLRDCLNSDDAMTLDDIGSAREAVAIDVSYWEA